MRLSLWFKALVLVGIVLLLIGISGCDPGPTVWKAQPSPDSFQHAEATK